MQQERSAAMTQDMKADNPHSIALHILNPLCDLQKSLLLHIIYIILQNRL